MFGLPGSPACSVRTGPHPCFEKRAIGRPAVDATWALEISLDVQWAHARASSADIPLIEAPNAKLCSMLAGVDAAVAMGAGVVSMSWGTPEFAAERGADGPGAETA